MSLFFRLEKAFRKRTKNDSPLCAFPLSKVKDTLVIEKGKELQKAQRTSLVLVPAKTQSQSSSGGSQAKENNAQRLKQAADAFSPNQNQTIQNATRTKKESNETGKDASTEDQSNAQNDELDLDFDNPDLDATDLDFGTDELSANEKEDLPVLEIDESGEVYPIESDEEESLPVPRKTHLPSLSGAHDALYLYMREISKFPLLKPEEEHELALRVRDKNDPDAAFRLVSSHLRLVVRIAIEFQRRWMQNVLDLIQEGNVGLMRAVNKFDPDKGIKFSYYASFWIKAYILKFIMDNWRMVKIGTTQVQRKLFFNLNKERQKLIAQGFDPDAAMLSERLGVSEEQINEMNQRMSFTDMSLNTTLNTSENDSASRMDFLPALGPGVEDSLASDEIVDIVRLRLKTILPHLTEKEQFILKNRLLTDEPLTLREIG
ncbi:MAG: sigma-70 family RNA polymerase sigma factor, partial [Desulfovibrio sp.]|nr:sigma-70 family RNA polymerase sigma factor [Desulfovibrio sp.]